MAPKKKPREKKPIRPDDDSKKSTKEPTEAPTEAPKENQKEDPKEEEGTADEVADDRDPGPPEGLDQPGQPRAQLRLAGAGMDRRRHHGTNARCAAPTLIVRPVYSLVPSSRIRTVAAIRSAVTMASRGRSSRFACVVP